MAHFLAEATVSWGSHCHERLESVRHARNPRQSRAGFTIGTSPASSWRQQPMRICGVGPPLSISSENDRDHAIAFASPDRAR
jgi:hypothetical protein